MEGKRDHAEGEAERGLTRSEIGHAGHSTRQ